MALKESNKNRKKKLQQPGAEWKPNPDARLVQDDEQPIPIQADTTIWAILIVALMVAFFAAL